ncbi:MAG: hypothetical protein ACREBA_10785 [Nitrosotalea sp.]
MSRLLSTSALDQNGIMTICPVNTPGRNSKLIQTSFGERELLGCQNSSGIRWFISNDITVILWRAVKNLTSAHENR